MWSVFRHCFYWYTEIERHPLDKDGNILPDNATEIAGYVYTVTYVRHREDNKGLLPIFEVSGTTGSVTYDAKIL